jgi:Flp pilus assembly protein TadG
MKWKLNLRKKWQGLAREDSGNVAIITAILLVVLIGLVALVVDVGHVKAVRNELQNAADAAALAGTRGMFPPAAPGAKYIPVEDPPWCGQGVTMAMTTVNRTDTQDLAIPQADVQTGTWDWTGNIFTPNAGCSLAINSMRVTVRKDSSANQPVNTWFARIFGRNTVDVAARATAAVGYVQGLPPRSGFPIAISEALKTQLMDSGETQGIALYPDKLDNGGWCGPLGYNPNPPNLKDWINNGVPTDIIIGKDIGLINGVEASVFDTLANQIELWKGYDKIPGTDVDNPGYGPDGGMFACLPVVTSDQYVDPSNPRFNQERTVDGFLPVIITKVVRPNTKDNPTNDFIIYVKWVDGYFCPNGSPSGGPVSQILATQPRLVGQQGSQF